MEESVGEVEKQSLNIKKAEQLLFLHYRFSQGNDNLGENILNYLHNRHPDWKISDEMAGQMVADLSPLVARYVTGGEKGEAVNHKTRSQTGAEDDLKKRVREMQQYFGQERVTPERFLILSIVNDMVTLDDKYLNELNGRPNRSGSPDSGNPASDPYLSHLVHYGLLGKTTGSDEYDRMFREVRDFVAEKPYSLDQQKLAAVITTHNKHHTEQITLPSIHTDTPQAA